MLLPWLACPSLKYSGLWAAVKYNLIMFLLIGLSPVVKLAFHHALMSQGANWKRNYAEVIWEDNLEAFCKIPIGQEHL